MAATEGALMQDQSFTRFENAQLAMLEQILNELRKIAAALAKDDHVIDHPQDDS
jgi:hypothetical protein